MKHQPKENKARTEKNNILSFWTSTLAQLFIFILAWRQREITSTVIGITAIALLTPNTVQFFINASKRGIKIIKYRLTGGKDATKDTTEAKPEVK